MAYEKKGSQNIKSKIRKMVTSLRFSIPNGIDDGNRYSLSNS